MQVFANREKIGALSKTGNTTVQLSASVITVGAKQYTTSNLVCDLTISGAGGLDTGAVAVNGLYFVHFVLQSNVGGLVCSLSNTVPVGFTQSNIVGAFYADDNLQVGAVFLDLITAETTFIEYDLVVGATTTPPTPHNNPTFNIAKWKRKGANMHLYFDYKHTTSDGQTGGSGIYLFPIPSTFTIDSGERLHANGTRGLGQVGSAYVGDNNVTGGVAIAQMFSATELALAYTNTIAGQIVYFIHNVGTAQWNDTNLTVSYEAVIPIVGWDSKLI